MALEGRRNQFHMQKYFQEDNTQHPMYNGTTYKIQYIAQDMRYIYMIDGSMILHRTEYIGPTASIHSLRTTTQNQVTINGNSVDAQLASNSNIHYQQYYNTVPATIHTTTTLLAAYSNNSSSIYHSHCSCNSQQ